MTSDFTLRKDLANAARWGVVKAVQAHRLGTAGFPSFACRYMHGEASDALRRLLTPESLGQDRDWGEAVPERPINARPDDALACLGLTRAQREVVQLRYVEDRTLLEIAGALGITASAVSQRLSVIHKKLRPPAAMSQAA